MCQARETDGILLSLGALFAVGMGGSFSSANLRDLLKGISILKSQAQICTQATSKAGLAYF